MIPQTRTTYSWMYRYAARPHAPVKIGERTFLYDVNGNQTGWKDKYNNTHRTIVWDEENRIQFIKDRAGASAAGPSGGSGGAPKVHAYKYDHTGQRRVKRTGTGWTVYVNQFYTVRNGQIATKHIFAGSTRIAAKVRTQDQLGNKTDKVYYYHPDHLGSTNYITNASGKIHEHTEYFPFGESWASESQNTKANPKLIPYLFTGKELDTETGLYYYGARYYDPRTSVWQSPDPILAKYLPTGNKKKDARLPGMGGIFKSANLNLFAYTYQNPVNYTDPSGDLPVAAWAAIGLAGPFVVVAVGYGIGYAVYTIVDFFIDLFSRRDKYEIKIKPEVKKPFNIFKGKLPEKSGIRFEFSRKEKIKEDKSEPSNQMTKTLNRLLNPKESEGTKLNKEIKSKVNGAIEKVKKAILFWLPDFLSDGIVDIGKSEFNKKQKEAMKKFFPDEGTPTEEPGSVFEKLDIIPKGFPKNDKE